MTEDWLTNDHRIDHEHAQLNATLRALRAVILHCRDTVLLAESLDIFGERMRMHFAEEERLAARLDAEAAEILRQDHRDLMAMVDRLRGMATARPAERQAAMSDLFAALEKHDREVDVPLFRLIALKAPNPSTTPRPDHPPRRDFGPN